MNEILVTSITGQSLYALIWDTSNKVAYIVGETFETHGTNSRTNADYDIPLIEVGSTGYYYADYPTWIERGRYYTIIKYRTGSVAVDSDQSIGGPVEKYWTGSAVVAIPETNAVSICNRALAILSGGDDTLTITTLSGATGPEKKTSDLCALYYTETRREVLARMQPQECSYYADLGAESSFSGEKAEWLYVFDLPSDFLIVVRQCDEQYHMMEYNQEIMQGYLFTNTYSNEDRDSAYILYVKNETDASAFSDEVTKAIYTLLASKLAPRIIAGDWGHKRRQELLEEYDTLVLPTSMGINRSMQHHSEEPRLSKYRCLGDRQYNYDYED